MTRQLDAVLREAGVSAADVAAVTPADLGVAQSVMGYGPRSMFWLLTEPYHNRKANRARAMGYSQWMHMLEADRVDVPSDQLGIQSETIITCPHATHGEDGCADVCLTWTGHGMRPGVHAGRQRRVKWLLDDPITYMAQLYVEMRRAIRRNTTDNYRGLFRLNATSDIRWELAVPWFFGMFGDQLFIDYTKWPPGRRQTPENYTLAWSAQASLHNLDHWLRARDAGMSTSIIVDHPLHLVEARPDIFVDAHRSDTWIIEHRDNPKVGALKPLRPMTSEHATVYKSWHILDMELDRWN